MKRYHKYFFIALLMTISVFLLLSGSAKAAIDGGYEGTAVCLGCHDGVSASDKTSFNHTGHPYKYRTTANTNPPPDAISQVLPTPLIVDISTLTPRSPIDDGTGHLSWTDIWYVIGGYGWKSRYGMQEGYVWTGSAVQYNPLADGVVRPLWSSYNPGTDKAYDCGICHNTNGTTDMLASRTEPWNALGQPAGGDGSSPGFTSQWTFDGVQCEACHGPGQAHVATPTDPFPVPVDTNGIKGNCSGCHHRSGANNHGADVSGGYIRHHEQYNEMVGSAAEPGVHASLDCIDCHNPHKRSHKVPGIVATALGITDNDQSAEARGAVVSCESCHPGHTTAKHTSLQCIDCHMAEAMKSATAETGTYGKMGDVKSHIVKINPDPAAVDTAAGDIMGGGKTIAHNYLSINYACAKCHDSSMSTYVGIPLTMTELGAAANDYHTPPVNQNLGFKDTQLNALTEADCRVCHSTTPPPGIPVDPTYNPDRHHLNMSTAIPVGHCADNPGTACQVDADCTEPNDYCIGDSQAPNATLSSTNYECLTCHTLIWDPVTMTSEFAPFRDCFICHTTEFQPDYPDRTQEANTHHRVAEATGGDCQHCHGSLVDAGLLDDDGDGIRNAIDTDDLVTPTNGWVPTYQPSLVTPWPSEKPNGGSANSRGTLEGNCNYCHDSSTTDTCDEVAGTCTVAGSPCTIDADCNGPILINHDTHHFTGLPSVEINPPTTQEACLWCHQPLFPGADIGFPKHDEFDIRVCENCHGIPSLHNIEADSNADGAITPGMEIPRFGHIGSNDDCVGCHGFTAASAPSSGPVIPFIANADSLTMTAGTDKTVTLTGAGFTNNVDTPVGPIELTSTVSLTASDGTVTALTPQSVNESEIVVTLPGSLAVGNYDLRAVKGPKSSNPVVMSVTPEVKITTVYCKRRGRMVIWGSGFGQKIAGTDDYINVEVNGNAVDILSWRNYRISASVPGGCSSEANVTVNALYGSASTGNKPPKPGKGK